MGQPFVVIDGVKYVVDEGRGTRVLRTRGEFETMIAKANQAKAEFNAPQDAEIARLRGLLAKFPN